MGLFVKFESENILTFFFLQELKLTFKNDLRDFFSFLSVACKCYHDFCDFHEGVYIFFYFFGII